MTRTLALATIVAACSSTPPASPPSDAAAAAASSDAASPGDANMAGLSEADFQALHELKADEAPAPRGEMIDVAQSRAYLSLPADGTAPMPAVVVIHEWWGLNQHIKYWADRLAADGYAALAVDLYGGKVGTTPDEAMALMKSVDDKRSLEILSGAHAFLKDDPRIQATRRGAIGWCAGGGWSLQHALNTKDLDAAVIYYGRLVDDEGKLGPLSADVLGIFGNQDKGIPPTAVDGFEAALKKLGKPHEIHRFEADHAFANPSGGRYDHEAAGKAWELTRAFLAKHLKSPS